MSPNSPLPEAQIDALAAAFQAAEQARQPLAPLAQRAPGLTLDDAYRVQAALIARKVAAGEHPVGHKLGATSQAIQAQLGLAEPVHAVLPAGCQLNSGASIPFDGLIHPRVECEIAFIMGQDLAGPVAGPEQAVAAVAMVVGALEIVDPRVQNWHVGPRDVIADNGLLARFVLGSERRDPAGLDLAGLEVVLRQNGTPVAQATGAAVLGHPAQALAWLVNRLSRTGRRLMTGDIVLTGALTPLFPASRGDRFEAEFDGLGRVAIHFV